MTSPNQGIEQAHASGRLLHTKRKRCAALVHVYYLCLWPQLAEYLSHLARCISFDLWINYVEGCATEHQVTLWKDAVVGQFPHVQLHCSPNLGLDIGGTLSLLGQINLLNYEYICKIHTKRNPRNLSKGSVWRKHLLDALLADPIKPLAEFKDPQVMMVGAQKYLCVGTGRNREHIARLALLFGLPSNCIDWPFIAGTMFWCRPVIFQRVKDSGLSQQDFEPGWKYDGTLAHAMERVLCYLAWDSGIIKGL